MFAAGASTCDQQMVVAVENGLGPAISQIDNVQTFYPIRPAFEADVLKQMIDKMGGEGVFVERGQLFYEVV